MAQQTAMEVDDDTNANVGEYEISDQLTEHQAPVRCLVTVGSDSIISGDRKGLFVHWTRKLEDDNNATNENNTNDNTDDNTNENSTHNDETGDGNNDQKMDGNKDSNDKSVVSKNNFNKRIIFDSLHDLTFSVISGNEIITSDNDKLSTFISVGDHMAIQWTLEGTILKQFIGHTNSVNSIDITYNQTQIITGSFDSTAKIWPLISETNNNNNKDNNNNQAEHVSPFKTLEGHTHGVEVCALQSGEIVTGTFKDIFIWDKDGKQIKPIKFAHDHAIRKIRRHPLGFVTCANDGYVKLWSNTGELIRKILAHPENGNTPSFIYSLAVDSTTHNIISCGEDGTAKIFNTDGMLVQQLRHAGAVWDVSLLDNGDIVTACADACVRVWSKDKSRIASSDYVEEYYNMLAMAVQAQGQVSDSQLEPMSVLSQPGNPGQFKMVQDPKKGPSVYQWDAQQGAWVYFGEILGNKGGGQGGGGQGGQGGSGTINGVKYDHVVYIDVNGNDKVALGFNVDDDPRQVSRDFCTVNGIDLDLAMQIENHLKPYANAQKRAERVERERIADTKVLKQLPNYKVCGFELNGKGNVDGLKKKILEFNNDPNLDASLKIGGNNDNIEEKSNIIKDETKVFQHLFGILSDQSNWHVTEFPDIAVKLIATKLINWPTDKILPVLDMIRLLMIHQSGVKKLLGFYTQEGNDKSNKQIAEIGINWGKKIREGILEHINGKDGKELTPNMQLVTCRILSNFLAKRPRSLDERQGKNCPQELVEFLVEALSGLSSAAENKKNSVYTAYLMMAHNAMLWYSKFKMKESDLYLMITSGLFEMFDTSLKSDKGGINEKILYYGLSVIGTIGWSSEEAKKEILSVYSDQLKEVVTQARHHETSGACREVGQDCFNLFGMT